MEEVFIPNGTSTQQMLLVALICVLSTWYLYFRWSRRNLYKHSRNVPGPISFPFIGSALYFVGNPFDISTRIFKMLYQYPRIFHAWCGTRLFYCVSDPKYYQILLPRYLEKERWYRFVEPALGHGLVTAPLDKWKNSRKIIMPTFNQKTLNGFMEIFSEQSEVLVEQMKKLEGKGEFDAMDCLAKCTLDIICETTMGVKMNAQTSEAPPPVLKHIERTMENMALRIFNIWYHIDFIYNMTSRSKDDKEAIKTLHDLSCSIIKQKKKLFDETKKRRDNAEEESFKKKALLDHLLEITADSTQFTEQQLEDEINTFILAGSDTTASTIGFAFLMLGMHKDLQEKVYEEIIEVVGPDRAVEKEDLANLHYLERFIKETLRLFPVGPIFAREIDKDVDLGDYIVPAGATVIFGLIKTHTDEKYFPDPYKFDPDRFLPEEVKKRHPCAYLPFSYGPRNCIGLKYAMMSMTTLLAAVIRRFKFSTSYKTVQDIEVKPLLTLKPKGGFKVSLESR